MKTIKKILLIIWLLSIILGRSIRDFLVDIGSIILVSFLNALVELYVAIRSIMTAMWWTISGFTEEITVEDENGDIIHHFPQINFPRE